MIPAWVLALLSTIVEAIGEGFMRGVMKAWREPNTFTNEKPNAQDDAVRDRFADAVQRVLADPKGSRPVGPNPPAPTGQAGDSHGAGPST